MNELLQRLQVLAQRPQEDDQGWARFIFGALVVLFWIISAAASAMGKNKEKKRRERVRQQIERPEPTPGPTGPRRPTPQRTPKPRPAQAPPKLPRANPVAAHRQRPIQQRQKSATVRSPFAAPEPAPAVMAYQAPTDSTTLPIASTDITKAQHASRGTYTGASAAMLAHWLNPWTLRQQYILTEILQPPVALRETRDMPLG